MHACTYVSCLLFVPFGISFKGLFLILRQMSCFSSRTVEGKVLRSLKERLRYTRVCERGKRSGREGRKWALRLSM